MNHEDLETSKALPIPAILELLLYLPYASRLRIVFKLLFYTGCRIEELRKFRRSRIIPFGAENHKVYWRPGKNQTGWRVEVLPNDFVEEIDVYLRTACVPKDYVVNIRSDRLRRELNELRPHLSPMWSERTDAPTENNFGNTEYKLQLKGFRKTFATLLFYYFWKVRYDDAYIAAEMTGKRMHHSTMKITVAHYIENVCTIDAEKYYKMLPVDLVRCVHQLRIMDFYGSELPRHDPDPMPIDFVHEERTGVLA